MNLNQLKNYLLNQQTMNKMEYIETFIPSKTVSIDNQEVYLFNETIDIQRRSLIEDSIFITQQPYCSHNPMHVHQFIELTYVLAGECDVLINHRVIHLTVGEMILVDQNTPHTVKEVNKGHLILSITLKKDFLSPSFLSRFTTQSLISKLLIDCVMTNRQTNRFILLNGGKNQRIIELLNSIIFEYFGKDLYAEEIINSYFIIFFSELIRQNEVMPSSEESKGHQSHCLNAFLQYIETHYSSCNLKEMADHFGFHPNYLSILLKRGTDKSFKELLQLQKMSKASIILLNSNLPITAIVEQVGYSSTTFFHKKFKEVYGVTPSRFRLNNQSNPVGHYKK